MKVKVYVGAPGVAFVRFDESWSQSFTDKNGKERPILSFTAKHDLNLNCDQAGTALASMVANGRLTATQAADIRAEAARLLEAK